MGASGEKQGEFFLMLKHSNVAELLPVECHECKWFLTALVSVHRSVATVARFAASQASKYPPKPFDRDDFSVLDRIRGIPGSHLHPGCNFPASFKPDLRSANGTGDWLGMKAAVKRIVVFSSAFRAHLKIRHGRLWAVIGNILDDRESRTAIGAIDEWVAITPVCWIK